MLFEVLYTFVLDGETKLPHMFVDIGDCDTGMRLLAIGAVVEVPIESELAAEPDAPESAADSYRERLFPLANPPDRERPTLSGSSRRCATRGSIRRRCGPASGSTGRRSGWAKCLRFVTSQWCAVRIVSAMLMSATSHVISRLWMRCRTAKPCRPADEVPERWRRPDGQAVGWWRPWPRRRRSSLLRTAALWPERAAASRPGASAGWPRRGNRAANCVSW